MTNYIPVKIADDFEERYPDSSPSATESAMNLVRTSDLLVKQISQLLRPFDLTPTSGLVLSILADSKLPLPPKDIADRLIITRATVTGLLDSLERHQYIQRTQHDTDRRMLLVEITDKGREIADAYRILIHQHQKQWFDVFSESEKQQFIGFMHRLQSSLLDED